MVQYWVFLLLSTLAYLCGDFFSKVYSEHASTQSLIELVVCYAASVMFWVFALKVEGQLSSAGAIWSIGAVVGTVLMGVFVFHEHMSPTNILGLFLAFVAIILLYN